MKLFPVNSAVIIVPSDIMSFPALFKNLLRTSGGLNSEINTDFFPVPLIGSLKFKENLFLMFDEGKRVQIIEQFPEKLPLSEARLDDDFSQISLATTQILSHLKFIALGLNFTFIVTEHEEIDRLIPSEFEEKFINAEIKLVKKLADSEVRLLFSRTQVTEHLEELGKNPIQLHVNFHHELKESADPLTQIKTLLDCREGFFRMVPELIATSFEKEGVS